MRYLLDTNVCVVYLNGRSSSVRDRYQLIGTTFSGRRLKIIFQLKAHNVVRIITGWPL